MASFRDLEMDWSGLKDSTQWSQEDLQLAAELGKTLLERNKELENALRQHQNVIEDQVQEIEYLTKQSVALREVNDSRLRIYEQLEVSIQDLERANHRHTLENAAEKKHVKSLTTTIETLETKNEDLQATIDDLRLQIDVLKRRTNRQNDSTSPASSTGVHLRHVELDSKNGSPKELFSVHNKNDECTNLLTPFKTKTDTSNTSTPISRRETLAPSSETDDIDGDSLLELEQKLRTEIREAKALLSREERRAAELQEQLETVQLQNRALENQLVQMHHREQPSMHDELRTLDEVRQGEMCSRCLRSMDKSDDPSMPEDDDASMLDSLMSPTPLRSSFSLEIQNHPETQSSPLTAVTKPPNARNQYKELVEKFGPLFENHTKSNKFMSLQEEMQLSGEFNTMSTRETDEESGHGDSLPMEKKNKRRQTPTDFSEAETSSSGYSDETSTKGTQTEDRGAFLCTIADGEDCKFSIYDDASPIDSRFRKRPEYRELFKEIFSVLKKAAEKKEEGQDLPLLDDITPIKQAPRVPPVTPCVDYLPDFMNDDDTNSVVSSTMSEMSTSQLEPTTVIENLIQEQNQIPDAPEPHKPALRPLKSELDYLSIESRKRSSSRRKNRHTLNNTSDRSDSPSVTPIIGHPTINYSTRPISGRRRRELRHLATDGAPSSSPQNDSWNGNTLQFYSSARSNVNSPTPSQGSGKCVEFKPSVAAKELKKLIKLDKTYAQVLKGRREKNMRQQKQQF